MGIRDDALIGNLAICSMSRVSGLPRGAISD
jgi:hypothetical protein